MSGEIVGKKRVGRNRRQLRLSVSDHAIVGAPLFARWGYVDSTPVQIGRQMGRRRVRLVIYPPGSSSRQRRALHLRLMFGSWLWWMFLSVVSLGVVAIAGRAAVVVFCVVVSLAWICIVVSTDRVRSQSHQINVVVTRAGPTSSYMLFDRLANELDVLDADLHLDPVAYEIQWQHIYDVAVLHTPGRDTVIGTK